MILTMETWLILEELSLYLPVVEHRESKGLSLCMCAKVSLKAKRVDSRDESLDGVERGPWNRCILGDVTSVRLQTKFYRGKFLDFKDNSYYVLISV